jgi:hypothetical protein
VTTDNPLLSVTKGDASAEDIAALIALFSVIGNSTAAEDDASHIQAWNSSGHLFQSFPVPGAGAWWSSGLPQ